MFRLGQSGFDGFRQRFRHHLDHGFDAGDALQARNGGEDGQGFRDDLSLDDGLGLDRLLLLLLRSLADAVERLLEDLRIVEDGRSVDGSGGSGRGGRHAGPAGSPEDAEELSERSEKGLNKTGPVTGTLRLDGSNHGAADQDGDAHLHFFVFEQNFKTEHEFKRIGDGRRETCASAEDGRRNECAGRHLAGPFLYVSFKSAAGMSIYTGENGIRKPIRTAYMWSFLPGVGHITFFCQDRPTCC